jgi:hypothetical protein
MKSNTVPIVLLVALVGALFVLGAAAATHVDQTDGIGTAQNGNLTFSDQATASSTFTGGEPSQPGVFVGEVSTDVDSAVMITYSESSLGAGDQVTIDLDNVGFQYWEVNGVSGDADSIDDVVVEDGNNPTLVFVEGVEYTFENLPGSNHPLEFFDGSGSALLSQTTEGSFEDDPDVGWTDTGNSVTFTATPPLAAELDGYVCTIHSNMEGGVQTTAETASDLVVAGLDTFDATELDGDNVQIPIEEFGGFPGTHTAHLIPTANLSGNYTPGDTVSNATASAAVDSDQATVYQGTLTLENQTVGGPIQEGDVLAEVATANLLDGAGNDTEFVVDVHPKDDHGNLLAGEFVGASAVLSGTNTGVEIIAERVPDDGEFNEFPLTGENDLVAMVHTVDDNASVGDPASPSQYPVLPHASPNGLVTGGVTDDAVVDYSLTQGLTFQDQQIGPDNAVTLENVQSVGSQVAIIVTYEETGDLVIAGLTTGTYNGETLTVTVEDTDGFPGEHTAHLLPVSGLSGNYTPGDTVSNETASNIVVQETATVGVDLTGDGNFSTDTTGDGLLNDADGDGEFDIFDVQAFFESYKTQTVQDNTGLFDFDEDGEVDIFDVQRLFDDLS